MGWDIKRSLARINYKIHTDAIKETIIPHSITLAQTGYIYASEADLLNVALLGMTAKDWREKTPVNLGIFGMPRPLNNLLSSPISKV